MSSTGKLGITAQKDIRSIFPSLHIQTTEVALSSTQCNGFREMSLKIKFRKTSERRNEIYSEVP